MNIVKNKTFYVEYGQKIISEDPRVFSLFKLENLPIFRNCTFKRKYIENPRESLVDITSSDFWDTFILHFNTCIFK